MFNKDREIPLANQNISKYHFTKEGDFAGLTIEDIYAGSEKAYMTEHLDDLTTYLVPGIA